MKQTHLIYILIISLIIVTLAYAEFTRDSMKIGSLTLDTNENTAKGTGPALELIARSTTAHAVIELDGLAGADRIDMSHIHYDADGYSNADAYQIFYHTGDLQAGDNNQVIQISVDEVAATGGEVDLIYFQTTDATAAMEKHAMHVGTGFDTALTVSGATKEQLDYGYEIASAVVIDRMNSGGAGDDAFDNVAVDQQIFDANGDYILIGSDATFEVIVVDLATYSSKQINALFYYSKAGNNWTALAVDDSTEGFTKSGNMVFDAPVDWTKDDQAIINADITDAYYIKIVRTYTPQIGIKPVEDIFYTYPERGGDTGMLIYGNGVIKLPYLTGAPTSAANGDLWMEADGLHIYYNGGESLVTAVP